MDNQFCDKSLPQCCGECGKTIRDRYFLYAKELYWHTRCLKCSICRVTLADAGKSFFERANLMLCKEDYIRLFGRNGKCYACHETIPPNEMVMKTFQDQVYHIRCFSCTRCRCPLSIGDRYRLCDGKIICCDGECMGLPARKGVVISRRGGRTARIPSAIKA